MLGRLLVRYLRPHWPLVVFVIVFQLAQSIASLSLPGLNADIIDRGVAQGDIGTVIALGAVMLAVTVVQIGCSLGAVYFGARLAMVFGHDLRAAVFERVGTFSEHDMSRFGAASLITRTTNDVQQVQMLVLMTATMIVMTPLVGIGGVVFAIREDPGLSAVLVVAVPVLLAAVTVIVVRMVPLFTGMQRRIDAVNRVLREQLTGIRVVRAFVREGAEAARFDVTNAELTDVALRAGRLFALMFPVVMLVLNVSSVAVVWFGAFRIDAGDLQIGSLIAFLSYLTQILMSVLLATMLGVLLPRAVVSGARIGEVLDTVSSVPTAPAVALPVTGRGRIELRQATFAYPGAEEPVLHAIDLAIEPGTTTAIIGSTGAGKSTLLGLVLRLFDVTSGAVLIDGVDVRDLDPQALWQRFASVPQRSYLFSGTVATNLRYGDPDADDDELWAALEVAQAREFVEAMPGGLSAVITQGGTNVSGGQRQRLTIARALVAHADISVFDDSFSALDAATDARLRASLAQARPDATRIVVAQRAATVVDADQIVVLEAGRIVGRGTHAELLRTCAEYVEIIESQRAREDAR